MFKAKPSMPDEWARVISSVQSTSVYGKVLPTIWWAITYFGDPLAAAGGWEGWGIDPVADGIVVDIEDKAVAVVDGEERVADAGLA
jgi:hypothetical protein